MTDAKKHHFVPQFLLKKFSFGKKNRERIWVFKKASGKSFAASVSDVGHENHFYNARNLDGARLELEPLTMKVDGFCADILHQIVETRAIPVAQESIEKLAIFIAAQMLRVPSSRNQMEEFRKAVIGKWGPDIRAGEDSRPVSDYSAEDSKFSSLLALRDIPVFADILRRKIWFLLEAPLGHNFIISDGSVVLHNHLDYGSRGSLGIAQKGIEVFMPLSPKLAVQLTCPEIANEMLKTEAGRVFQYYQNRGLPVPLHAANVEFINSLQVIQSERFLYAADGGEFELAREMMRDHPELAQPSTARMEHN